MSLIITLAVDDIERSTRFYRDILQLPAERHTLKENNQDILLLKQGDSTILLRETAAVEAEHPAALQHLQRQPRGVGVSFDFQIENMDRVLHTIEQQGVSTLHEMDDREHGLRELWLYDPDHYLIILTQVAAADSGY